ncbi:MAG TPA: hypothetical protein VMG63_17255, partial [Terriglobia bacterium]|nr:hypothetical protein [Terriglobia bacterium]
RNALLLPMKPNSHIVIVSSMAAINGSPLSGSYAGAKRMLWFMADYAAQEVNRQKLGLHIHCLLPTLNPSTDLGRAAIAAYAERAGVGIDEFANRLAPHLTPAVMGDAVVELHSNPTRLSAAPKNWSTLAAECRPVGWLRSVMAVEEYGPGCCFYYAGCSPCLEPCARYDLP